MSMLAPWAKIAAGPSHGTILSGLRLGTHLLKTLKGSPGASGAGTPLSALAFQVARVKGRGDLAMVKAPKAGPLSGGQARAVSDGKSF